jgi:hypothetical protein
MGAYAALAARFTTTQAGTTLVSSTSAAHFCRCVHSQPWPPPCSTTLVPPPLL